MFTLKPFQEKITTSAIRNLQKGLSSFVVAPTGSGKMVMLSYIASVLDCNVLILEHRVELMEQAEETIEKFGIKPSTMISGIVDRNPQSNVKIAMIQTINRRELVDWVPDVIIIDEAHLSAARSYISIMERYPNALRLCFSATPERLDGKGFDHICDEIIVGPSIRELIDSGDLVDFNYYSYEGVDLSIVRTIAGEYDQDAVAEQMSGMAEDIIDTWADTCSHRQTVIFTSNKKQSKNLCAMLRSRGYYAEHVDGDTPDGVRKSIMKRYRAGLTKILCNCGIVIEGFDVKSISCVVLAMATKSLSKYLQCIGRGTRVFPGKKDLTILDFGNNSAMHGQPDDEREWSLSPRQTSKRGPRDREYVEDDGEENISTPQYKERYTIEEYDYGLDSEYNRGEYQRSDRNIGESGSVRSAPAWLPLGWKKWWIELERYRIANRLPAGYSEDHARGLIHSGRR